ncbi:hypothetical protein RFI_07267 [Reticulomyxa filosa]|uniref:NYN domain-containing protein n=1 Tax=Reticulomyxa filosa TaxID=46433 RepID=X6NX33_RETFI|nr:hypothetical protein RFI_07267 [Reticulomyxa filosa]|eukprot:ETO29852.1 hypothetical protein RFI_07267 [Reticulomyxa filosa]
MTDAVAYVVKEIKRVVDDKLQYSAQKVECAFFFYVFKRKQKKTGTKNVINSKKKKKQDDKKKKEILLYCAADRIHFKAREDFTDSGVRIMDVPTKRKQESVDKRIIADLALNAADLAQRKQRGVICLISGDSDFGYVLSRLHGRPQISSIILITKTTHVRESLKSHVDFVVPFFEQLSNVENPFSKRNQRFLDSNHSSPHYNNHSSFHRPHPAFNAGRNRQSFDGYPDTMNRSYHNGMLTQAQASGGGYSYNSGSNHNHNHGNTNYGHDRGYFRGYSHGHGNGHGHGHGNGHNHGHTHSHTPASTFDSNRDNNEKRDKDTANSLVAVGSGGEYRSKSQPRPTAESDGGPHDASHHPLNVSLTPQLGSMADVVSNAHLHPAHSTYRPVTATNGNKEHHSPEKKGQREHFGDGDNNNGSNGNNNNNGNNANNKNSGNIHNNSSRSTVITEADMKNTKMPMSPKNSEAKPAIPFPYVTSEDIEKNLKVARRTDAQTEAGVAIEMEVDVDADNADASNGNNKNKSYNYDKVTNSIHHALAFFYEKPKVKSGSSNTGKAGGGTANKNSASSNSGSNGSSSDVSSNNKHESGVTSADKRQDAKGLKSEMPLASTSKDNPKHNATLSSLHENDTAYTFFFLKKKNKHGEEEQKCLLFVNTNKTNKSKISLFDEQVSLDDLKVTPTEWDSKFFLENIVPSQSDLINESTLFDHILPTWQEIQRHSDIACCDGSNNRSSSAINNRSSNNDNDNDGDNSKMEKAIATAATAIATATRGQARGPKKNALYPNDKTVRANLVIQTVRQLSKQSFGGNPTREEVSASLRRNYPSIEDQVLMGGVPAQKWIEKSIDYALYYGVVEELSGRISTPVISPQIVSCLRAQPSMYVDINHISKHLQEHAPPEISELCRPSNVFTICYQCRFKFSICKDDKLLSKKCSLGESNDIGSVRVKGFFEVYEKSFLKPTFNSFKLGKFVCVLFFLDFFSYIIKQKKKKLFNKTKKFVCLRFFYGKKKKEEAVKCVFCVDRLCSFCFWSPFLLLS